MNPLLQAGWLPITAGFGVMMLAVGLGALRSAALPAALAWTAVLLGVAFVTPASIFAFMAMPVWVIAATIVIHQKSSRCIRVAGQAPRLGAH